MKCGCCSHCVAVVFPEPPQWKFVNAKLAWPLVRMPTIMRKPEQAPYKWDWQHVWNLYDTVIDRFCFYRFHSIRSHFWTAELLCNETEPRVIIRSYNDVWCVMCKCSVAQSDSLIKYFTAIISYILFSGFSSPDCFFVLNHVIREHIMGYFVLFLNCQKIKGLMIRPPAISETEFDVKICLLSPRMLFQVP